MYVRRINGKVIKPNNEPDGYWDDEMECLYNETYKKYFSSVWNTTPTKNADGLFCLARSLDVNGNMETWKFSTEIHKKLHRLQENGVWSYAS